jgi:S-adenosylmethionine uptake transporter
MIGSFLVIAAYKHGEATRVAPMQYSQILWAAFFGYVFFGETPGVATVLGAAVIILSGLYILFREGRANVSENQPVLQSQGRPETGTVPRVSLLRQLMTRRGPSRE